MLDDIFQPISVWFSFRLRIATEGSCLNGFGGMFKSQINNVCSQQGHKH